MTRYAIICAALALSSCGPIHGASSDISPAKNSPRGEILTDLMDSRSSLVKFCDQGRAVYVADYNGTGVAVVENASECATRSSLTPDGGTQ